MGLSHNYNDILGVNRLLLCLLFYFVVFESSLGVFVLAAAIAKLVK